VTEKEWHLEVGSDVVRDEFFAECWWRGIHWATVLERDGDYLLRIERLQGAESIEIPFDAAHAAVTEARQRVQLADGDASKR
jgi:hypothetical protein